MHFWNAEPQLSSGPLADLSFQVRPPFAGSKNGAFLSQFCTRSRRQCVEHDARREKFGENLGLRCAREVDEIEGDGSAFKAGELGGDERVAVRPVTAQGSDFAVAESL